MMVPKTYVFDPMFPNHGLSHHESVRRYLENTFKDKICYVVDENYLGSKSAKCFFSRFQKFLTGFYLLQKTFSFSLKYRKELKGNTLFLPHSDFVSTTILLMARKINLIDVKLIIRIIGIQDYTTVGNVKKKFIKSFLNKFLCNGDKLAAETKALARSIQEIQGSVRSVVHTPYPGFIHIANEIKPKIGNVVLFIGNPREDKGYLEVLNMAKAVSSLKWRIQLPSDEDWMLLKTLSELGPFPNVEFFKAPENDRSLIIEISKAQALIMPYSKSVFSERGSGILTAGVLMNKVIFGETETSFREECDGFTPFYDWNELKKPPSFDNQKKLDAGQDFSSYVSSKWEYLLS